MKGTSFVETALLVYQNPYDAMEKLIVGMLVMKLTVRNVSMNSTLVYIIYYFHLRGASTSLSQKLRFFKKLYIVLQFSSCRLLLP